MKNMYLHNTKLSVLTLNLFGILILRFLQISGSIIHYNKIGGEVIIIVNQWFFLITETIQLLNIPILA